MTANLPAVACDVCPKPGSCCQDLHLSTENGSLLSLWVDEGGSRLKALVMMAERGLPFLPNEGELGEVDGRKFAYFSVSCPELQGDGRCGIYQHRPQLCHDYKPGQDALCVYGRPT